MKRRTICFKVPEDVAMKLQEIKERCNLSNTAIVLGALDALFGIVFDEEGNFRDSPKDIER